jgi:outer membrane immunogenic protein
MKKLLLAGIAGVAFLAAGSAHAADLGVGPYRAAPALGPIPIFTWSGCYLGGHGGGGFGRKNAGDPTGADFAALGEGVRVHTSGFLAGGQVGCDWQFAPNWLVGLEGAGAWADIKGNSVDVFTQTTGGSVAPTVNTTTATVSARTDFLADVTARIGWAWDRWLVYAKGGVAWDRDKYGFVGRRTCSGALCFGGPGPFPFNFTGSETRIGWTAGAGIEWAFWGNWSARLEYDFYDFGNHRVTLVDSLGAFPAAPADINQQIHTVKFGINYRFNFGKTPAPVVARY